VTKEHLKQKGMTLIELLISISIGSFVMIMLMNILSTTLISRNYMDHENRLLQESYHISEFLQAQIFDMGVRSIETIVQDENDQILQLNHEYDLRTDPYSGVIYRDYSNKESYVLHFDMVNKSLYYGPEEYFDFGNRQFLDREAYRVNSPDVEVEPGTTDDPVTILDYTCVAEAEFQGGEVKCASAIINLKITLTFTIENRPIFRPKTYQSTIVF